MSRMTVEAWKSPLRCTRQCTSPDRVQPPGSIDQATCEDHTRGRAVTVHDGELHALIPVGGIELLVRAPPRGETSVDGVQGCDGRDVRYAVDDVEVTGDIDPGAFAGRLDVPDGPFVVCRVVVGSLDRSHARRGRPGAAEGTGALGERSTRVQRGQVLAGAPLHGGGISPM